MSGDEGGNAGAPADSQQLNIRLKNMDGSEVYFKVLQTTPFRKIISAFCTKTGLSSSNVRLMFEGESITGNMTPKELELEDNDVIDVLSQQTGGYSY